MRRFNPDFLRVGDAPTADKPAIIAIAGELGYLGTLYREYQRHVDLLLSCAAYDAGFKLNHSNLPTCE